MDYLKKLIGYYHSYKNKIIYSIYVMAAIITVLGFVTGKFSCNEYISPDKNLTAKDVGVDSQSVSRKFSRVSNQSPAKSDEDYDKIALLEKYIVSKNVKELYSNNSYTYQEMRNSVIPFKDEEYVLNNISDSSKVISFDYLFNSSSESYFSTKYYYYLSNSSMVLSIVIIFKSNNNSDKFIPIISHSVVTQPNSYMDFQSPIYEDTRNGRFLTIPKESGGNSGCNENKIYRFENGVWQKIEKRNLEESFKSYLPDSLSVWNCVYFSYDSLLVRTKIWRKDDAHCCPTGGSAWIKLGIKNHTFVVENFKYNPKTISN